MAAEQIAVSGLARYRGVPVATVTFGTPGNQTAASATTHSLTIFTKIDKSLEADIAESRNNDNEVVAIARTNKRIKLSFSASPAAATRDAAITIAEACPYPGDVVVVTCTEDAQIGAAVTWVESASASFSPDGELVLDFVVVERPQTLVPAS